MCYIISFSQCNFLSYNLIDLTNAYSGWWNSEQILFLDSFYSYSHHITIHNHPSHTGWERERASPAAIHLYLCDVKGAHAATRSSVVITLLPTWSRLESRYKFHSSPFTLLFGSTVFITKKSSLNTLDEYTHSHAFQIQ